MKVTTFQARHCGQVFEGAAGAAELAAHMKAHRAETPRRYLAPLPKGPSHKPLPWKAPRAGTAAGLERLEAKLEEGAYDLTFAFAGGTHRETVRMGEAA